MSITLTEKQLQSEVLELARMFGWRHYHPFDSRRSPSGFPDLVLARERVIYAELKTNHGRLTPHQESWLITLREAGQEVYVWRPDDLQAIAQILARRTARKAA